MTITARCTVHGDILRFEHALGLPDGTLVEVTILRQHDTPQDQLPGDGTSASAKTSADNPIQDSQGDELDRPH